MRLLEWIRIPVLHVILATFIGFLLTFVEGQPKVVQEMMCQLGKFLKLTDFEVGNLQQSKAVGR